MTEAGFAREGFVQVPGILSQDECAAALRNVDLAAAGSVGTRRLLAQPWCALLAGQLRAHPSLSACIDADNVAVQCTYFRKSAERNWLVPFHQDLSIPVAARVDDPALQGWCEKEGILFVRPGRDVLAQLVAVRIHLDRCGADDGALRVLPATHAGGVLRDAEVLAAREYGIEKLCLAAAGDALVMRPLLLHASSKGCAGSARRVLHFVFGPSQLPHGLRWNVLA